MRVTLRPQGVLLSELSMSRSYKLSAFAGGELMQQVFVMSGIRGTGGMYNPATVHVYSI